MSITVAAVDLGASSGRVVLGEVGEDRLEIEAVARFPNEPVRLPDGLHWNITELFARTVEGIGNAALHAGGALRSVAVDSWAVDYGLLTAGRLLGVPYHYRDERRAAGAEMVHQQLTHAEAYRRNGLQFLPFNTLYQLAADTQSATAEQLLLIPDLLSYWLTGQQVTERTNASTTGLLSIDTGEWDTELMDLLGYRRSLFTALVDPGQHVGTLLPGIGERTGCPGLEVVTVGSHDTASAVVAVPIRTDTAAYISCGTWGLVGLELEHPVLSEASREANFTNEGGVGGRIRFLTNVMGLWLLSETMRQWDRDGTSVSLKAVLGGAAAVDHAPVFDVQDPRFVSPGDMPARIVAWFAERELAAPETQAAMVRSILESLALAFAQAVDQAETLAGRPIKTIHVVGGGALNQLLCQLIADRSGRTVLAGPVEATALGNVLVQGQAAGVVAEDLDQLRHLVARTQELREHLPRSDREKVSR